MVNRPARFTVADLVRAGKAVKQLGQDWCVEVKPDGSIRLLQDGARKPEHQPDPIEDKVTILF